MLYKYRYYFLLFLLFSTVMLVTGCSSYYGEYNVYGRVSTHEYAVSGARIILENSNSQKSTYTDTYGKYSFSGIKHGTYYLRVESNEYSDFVKQYYINSDTEINVDLTEKLGDGRVYGYIDIYNNTGFMSSLSADEKFAAEAIAFKTATDENMYRESEIIVKYKNMISSQSVSKLENENKLKKMNILNLHKGRVVKYKLPQGKDVKTVVDYYNDMEEVVWAEPNYIAHALARPNDPAYSVQWGHITVNMEAAWDIRHDSSDVTVSVVDTGIILPHPDLSEHLIQGTDFVDGPENDDPSNYNVTDFVATDETLRVDGGSHGTHVSGIIGAIGNNNQGITGINWKVNIMPVRVLNADGSGDYFDIAEGIYYAIDHGADIINLSLGGAKYSQNLSAAVTAADNAGVIMVAASGNDGANSVLYPARFQETIAVGAVDRNNNITDYSNYGPGLDLVAPGGTSVADKSTKIYSTWGFYNPDEGTVSSDYAYMNGTSMATAFVSGVASLLLADGVSPSQIKSRLTSTAVDLNYEGRDDQSGYGLVDAYGALLNKRLENPYVFAAKEDDDTLYIKSEVNIMKNDGYYELQEVASEEVHIYCWRDVNENQIIDAGDYYGKSSSSLSIAEDSNYRQDLDVYYVTTSSSDNLEVQGMTALK